MSDEKLLPCPFCGERLKFHSPRYGDDYYRHSRDDACPLGGDTFRDPLAVFDNPESIAAWNRHDRARAAILADRVAQRELSDEEIDKLSERHFGVLVTVESNMTLMRAFARAVLAAGGRHG